jgi:ornithine--oxo-acid transaminase
MAFDLNTLIERRRHEKFDLYARYINDGRVHSASQMGFDRHFVRGEGCHVFDREGNCYLDCDGGNGVFLVGRNNTVVRSAIATLLEGSPANWVGRDTPLLAALLAEALVDHMPEGLGRVLFTNAGAETVEAALKFARKATGRPRILFLRGDFHGLTYGALSVTDSGSRLPLMEQGFGPLLPGCEALPWNDSVQLERELVLEDVAGLIIEPIQGASAKSLEPSYLHSARELCDRYGTILIADEILTGLGRTGAFLACEQQGVVPDVVLLAKALSGGIMPVGAMIMRTTIYERLFRSRDMFIHASTFAENDYAMAAGLATLAVIDAEDLARRASERGIQLVEGLRRIQARHPSIAEVRGRGLLAGIELKASGGWLRQPGARYLERRGLLGHLCVMWLSLGYRVLASAPTRNNVLRLQPPLVISETETAQAIDAIDAVLTQAERFPEGAGRIILRRLLKLYGRR